MHNHKSQSGLHLQTQKQIRDHHRALYDTIANEYSLDWYGLRVPSVWYDMAVTQVTQHFRDSIERKSEPWTS